MKKVKLKEKQMETFNIQFVDENYLVFGLLINQKILTKMFGFFFLFCFQQVLVSFYSSSSSNLKKTLCSEMQIRVQIQRAKITERQCFSSLTVMKHV